MQVYDRVRVIQPDRILNQDMVEWIKNHSDIIFKIERIMPQTLDICRDKEWETILSYNVVKLFKVDFWLTEDLIGLP
jgi:hypothetical protein